MGNPLPTIESITDHNKEYNSSYINGNKLKIMHKALQPSNKQLQRSLDILDDPYEVSIKQSMQGPSSEIIFNIRRMVNVEERNKVVTFLHRVSAVLKKNLTTYEAEMKRLREMEEIIASVVDALKEAENPYLDEVTDMMSQLSRAFSKYLSNCQEFSMHRINILRMLNSLKTILNISWRMDEFKYDSYANIADFDNFFPLVDTINEELRLHSFHHLPLTDVQNLKLKISSTAFPEKALQTNFNKILKTSDNFLNIIQNRICTALGERVGKTSTIKSHALTVSFDNVSCFYCLFWPKIANEWISRERLWPSLDVIDRITKSGSYIVAKSRPGSDNELDWRWSFSTAEMQLAEERTPIMRYCYFIFKSMFYKYFKFKIQEKSLPSYVAKTCMLYVSEMHPSEWWGGLEEINLNNVSYCVLELLKFLVKKLEEGCLSHYFIKEINLLTHVPTGILTKSVEIASRIVFNPQKYITFKLETMAVVRELYDDLLNISTTSLTTSITKTTTAPVGTVVKLNLPAKSNNNSRRTSSKGIKKLERILEIENKLLVNRLKSFRLQGVWNYNKHRWRISLFETLTSKQEECIKQAGENLTPEHLQLQELVVANRKSISEWNTQLELYTKALLAGLMEICHLLQMYCLVCDVCFQKIPCQSNRYHCTEGCNYDVCENCYANNCRKINKSSSMPCDDSQVASVKPSLQGIHQHLIQHTITCSMNCYTKLPDQVQQMDAERYLDQIRSLQQEGHDLVGQLGINSEGLCDAYLDSGEILKDLFSEVFGNGRNAVIEQHPNVRKVEQIGIVTSITIVVF